jgi:hypothetical protein
MNRKSFVVLALFALLSSLVAAQTFRGAVQGTVEDSSGAAVTSAKVTITSPSTGLSRSVETDATGNYSFNELPLGSYDISATKAGFRTQAVKGVEVTVSSTQRVDVKLTPGQVTETVEVTAGVPLVDSAGTTIGGTIESRQFEQLPVNGRDFIKIIGLVPGAAADASAVSDSAGSFGQFSINGGRGRSNNYLLDGTDINDGYRNDSAINEAGVFGTPATLLPVDAVETIGVLSNTEAEFGRNGGAIVNVVTKSGTNDFHGSLFEFFRNNALDARNYFNAKPNNQDKFQNNQFGGSLGGPIVRGKTFFFAAYEGQREKVGIPTVVTVPTQADIAAATTAIGGPGNINPVISKLLALNPWTQGQAPPATNGSQTLSALGTNRLDSVIMKVDHHFNNADVFTGRYFFGDSDQSFPLGLVGGSSVPGYNTVTPTRVQVLSLSDTHVFNSRWLMEVRGGWNRFAETFFPEDKSFDPGSIGLATVTDSQDFGLPLIKVSGYSNIGANASLPRGRVDTNWQYFTNFSYNVGRHNWKFGYEFRRTKVDQFFDAGYRGVLSFDDLPNFLQGNVSGGRQAKGVSNRGTHQNNHGFYAQDNFRWTNKLTVNYGIRWDYFGVIGEDKNRFSILDPNPTTGGLKFVGSPGLDSLYPKDWNNFSPRVGIAYDVFGSGKTVVRAGYGLAYDAFSQDFFAGQLPFNTFNPGPAFNPGGPDPILFSFSPVGTIVSGAPVFGGFSDSDVFTVDQKLKTPFMQNFNLNVQQQLGPKVAVQVGYAGSTGKRLFRYRDINQGTPGVAGRPFDGGPLAPSGGTFFYVNQFESTSASWYNSLQTSLNIRDWHGFSSTLNYTWSHSIDNASDGQDFVANATQPDNSFNPNAERADSNFDVRHGFKWFFNYNFPKTQHWLTNGWGMEGVLALNSGQPFSVTWQFEDDYNGTGEFFGRPDLVGNPFTGRRTPDQFLNLSAFAAPCTPDGAGSCAGGQHYGDLRRNAFVGPGYRNFDFSFSKNNRVTERLNVQFKVDAFNIFNHPNFSNPVLPNFAVDFLANGIDPVTNRGIGFLPITATPDVGIGNPFLGGGGPRNLQLSVKFNF